ncbi:hypothetical protein ACC758_38740, partial [Rhizobium ruizarguesonis]
LNQGKLLFSGKPMEMTERVKDRVFRVSGVTGLRLQVLAELLQADGIFEARRRRSECCAIDGLADIGLLVLRRDETDSLALDDAVDD